MSKLYELTGNSLTMHTTIRNSEAQEVNTSIGNHLYFPLAGEDFEGLLINDKSLDDLLGEGSETIVQNHSTLFLLTTWATAPL